MGVAEAPPLEEVRVHSVHSSHALGVQLALAVHVHYVEPDGSERRAAWGRCVFSQFGFTQKGTAATGDGYTGISNWKLYVNDSKSCKQCCIAGDTYHST